MKDFDGWTQEKKRIHELSHGIYFHPREAWWCSLGVNVGFEQDGKNEGYSRPIIILKKYSTNACLVVPLTSKPKTGIYYFDVGDIDGESAKAILSQIKFIDKRRLTNKISTIDQQIFDKLRAAIIQINLS